MRKHPEQKFQTLVTPILRKRLFETPLVGVINAWARIYTHLKLNHQTGITTHQKVPPPVSKNSKPYPTQNATHRAYLNTTVSNHSFAGLRRRALTYAPTTTRPPTQSQPKVGQVQQATQSTQAASQATPPAGQTPPVETPTYIAQTLYASVTQKKQATPHAQPPRRYNFHSGSPTPWSVFALFSHASPVFSIIDTSPVPIETAQTVIECCFAARVSKQNGLVRICKFAAAYHQFSHRNSPLLATTGVGALIAVTTWLLSLHARGRSVPAAGRYALRVFAEALSLDIPATSPAALAATRSHTVRLARQAPCFTLHMLLTFGRLAADHGPPHPARYFAACVMMMVFAPFRFADTLNIRGIPYKKTTVAGSCLPTKNLKIPFYWAFPMSGFITNGAWFDIIVDVRTRYHSCKGLPMNFLFVHTTNWKFDDTVYPAATYASTLRTFRLFLTKAG